MALSWVPSRWNPADPISRIFEFKGQQHAVILAGATEPVVKLPPTPATHYMGSVTYRG